MRDTPTYMQISAQVVMKAWEHFVVTGERSFRFPVVLPQGPFIQDTHQAVSAQTVEYMVITLQIVKDWHSYRMVSEDADIQRRLDLMDVECRMAEADIAWMRSGRYRNELEQLKAENRALRKEYEAAANSLYELYKRSNM